MLRWRSHGQAPQESRQTRTGAYHAPRKPGHANAPTYEPEPEPTIEEAGAGLFGTVPKPARKKKAPKPIKRVFAITLTESGPFAFAGIWDSWKRPDGTQLETFALVTTGPNELVAQIHDLLALILHPRDYDRWLAIPESGDPRPPLDLLHPYDAARMKMTPANPAVGNWRNNGPEMLRPTEMQECFF